MKKIIVLLMISILLIYGCSSTQKVDTDRIVNINTIKSYLPLLEQVSTTATSMVLRNQSDDMRSKVNQISTEVLQHLDDDINSQDVNDGLRHIVDEVLDRQNLQKDVKELVRFIFEFTLSMTDNMVQSHLDNINENRAEIVRLVMESIVKGIQRGSSGEINV